MLHTAKQSALPAQGASVVNINDFRNRDVIRLCEQLLQKAISGELTGLIYTARLDDEDHAVAAVGCYARDPMVGLPAMAKMAAILESHVKSNL